MDRVDFGTGLQHLHQVKGFECGVLLHHCIQYCLQDMMPIDIAWHHMAGRNAYAACLDTSPFQSKDSHNMLLGSQRAF